MQKKIITSIALSFISVSIFSINILKSTKDTIQNEKCFGQEIELKTERVEKNRKFIFWKLSHKKIIITDRVINTDGKVIMKKRTIHICSMDACDAVKFRRIKIIEKEIWFFQYNRNPEKALIKRYDYCGKYLGKEDWDQKKSFEDY